MSSDAYSLSMLAQKSCKPCTASTLPLNPEQIKMLLQQLDSWEHQGKIISKTFTFTNYYQIMSFVNAVAWIANREDHHPELTVSYNKCRVEFSTHAIDGLSENDFICAARVDALLTV
jgi:4a-hydroxytetrahydrobiopterin dehydratase